MKMYNNGQRPTKMYGGGMAMPRKPMGGLAEQNRVQPTTMAKNMGATEPKRFSMGMNLGGAIKKFEKKSNGGKLVGNQKKLDKNKDGRISGIDFAMMRK
tara:strand:+ start:237 stop:533 length:297 start_codon:yes stop_codon:yes gene_type:complete